MGHKEEGGICEKIKKHKKVIICLLIILVLFYICKYTNLLCGQGFGFGRPMYEEISVPGLMQTDMYETVILR